MMSLTKSYKIVIIGESMVGKTSILMRYIKGEWVKVEERTVNTNCFNQMVKMNNLALPINIWDTAGEERYHALTPIFYRDADGAVLVFDLSNRDSFNLAEKWFLELMNYTKDTKIILVGNKCDLQRNEVTSEEARELADKYGSKYLSVSALNGANISEIFSTLTLEIYYYKMKLSKENLQRRKSKKSMKVLSEKNHKINEGGCC